MAYPAPLKDQIITLRTEILKLLQAHHDTIFLRFLQATSPDGTPLSGEGPRASSISAKIVAQLTRSLYGHSRETSAHPPMQPEPWPLWAVEIDILDREMDAIENEMEAMIKGIENLQRGGWWGSYEICRDAEDRLSALWFRSK